MELQITCYRIIVVNLAMLLAKLVQEVLRHNANLVFQINFSFLTLVGIPVLMELQIISYKIIFVNLAMSLAKLVQEILIYNA